MIRISTQFVKSPLQQLFSVKRICRDEDINDLRQMQIKEDELKQIRRFARNKSYRPFIKAALIKMSNKWILVYW